MRGRSFWGMLGWCCLLLCLPGRGNGASPINNATDLENGSTVVGSDTYRLNSGHWSIDTSFAINANTVKNLSIADAGTKLVVDNSGSGISNDHFTVQDFSISAGELEVLGGGYLSMRTMGGFTQSGGTVTAVGGPGTSSKGLYVTGLYRMSGGELIARGQSGTPANNNYAVEMAGGLTQTDGIIRAYGGQNSSSAFAPGITIGSAQGFVKEGGTVYAYGGVGNGSGIMANIFTHKGGETYATGGDTGGGVGTQATGISVSNRFDMIDGIVTCQGGSAPGSSFGMYSQAALNQTGGTINAYGGSGSAAIGLASSSPIVQTAGTLLARGGQGASAYGVWSTYLPASGRNGSMDMGAEVRIERTGATASIHLADAAMRFSSSSVLTPVVDLAKSEALASGLIESAGASVVTIDSGATLRPFVRNASSLSGGGSFRTDFIVSDNPIQGEFLADFSTLTLAATAEKAADGKSYALVFTRGESLQSVVDREIKYDNARDLLGNVIGYTDANGDCHLKSLRDNLDNCRTLDEFHAESARISRRTTPQAYTKLTHGIHRIGNLTELDFRRQLRLQDGFGAPAVAAAPAVSSAAGLANLVWTARHGLVDPGALRIWASPIYQQSSRFRAHEAEFDEAKEKYYGGSVGLGRSFGCLSVGGGLHYVRGDYEAGESDIDTDNYSVSLGARYSGFVPDNRWFNPWADLVLGYTYSDIDQKLLDVDDVFKFSSPHANQFRAGLDIGNRMALTECLVLNPLLGLDYAHVKQSGYHERGASNYLLRLDGGGFDSLRLKAGLELEAALGSRFIVTARGVYRYETLDRNSRFGARFAAFPDLTFKTVGEARGRSSGYVGAGVKIIARERVSLGLNYDMLLESGYMAHQFTANIGISF